MLRKWTKRTPEQAQDIDVLSEIADQPYAAYQTTISALSTVGVLDPFMMGTARNHLIFWHLLSSAQRAAARSARGLRVAGLLPNLKRAFVLASTDSLAPQGFNSSNQSAHWDEDELVNAVYRI